MKKYVFLTCGVFGVGGGQLYIANKTDYLTKRGYEVHTVSSSVFSIGGVLVYQKLNLAKNHILTDLRYAPDVYSRKRQDANIEKLIASLELGEADEVILESNYLDGAIWGERAAARIGAKHVVFSVSEHNAADAYMLEFLEFKFRRGELATISKNSFENILGTSSVITEQGLPLLRAYLGDAIEDVPCAALEKVQKGDFNVCIMGRGEKRYVEYACLSLAAFCEKHPSFRFSVVLIAEFRDAGKEQAIREAFGAASNVQFYHLGYLSPIPTALMRFFDLYIGGAGCASLFYRQKALTLAMDLYNDRPLGFMGYDVYATNVISAEDASMDACLEDAFFQKEYLKKEYRPAPVMSADEAFSYHDTFLEGGSREHAYFTAVNRNVSKKELLKVHCPFLVTAKNKLVKWIGKT